MLSKEQKLVNQTVERIRQEILGQTIGVQSDEIVHSNIVDLRKSLIEHYKGLLILFRTHKELGFMIGDIVKNTDKIIGHIDAIEGHSSENIKDKKIVLDDFLDLATVVTNLEAVLNIKIDQLEAEK